MIFYEILCLMNACKPSACTCTIFRYWLNDVKFLQNHCSHFSRAATIQGWHLMTINSYYKLGKIKAYSGKKYLL